MSVSHSRRIGLLKHLKSKTLLNLLTTSSSLSGGQAVTALAGESEEAREGPRLTTCEIPNWNSEHLKHLNFLDAATQRIRIKNYAAFSSPFFLP